MRTHCLIAMIAVLSLSAPAAFAQDADANYDRMDGTGASGKTVNVIEWEGNLEIHVAPPGSLKGLALKLDKANQSKPVMVIGYRFDSDPSTQLIRRAILGIDMREGFKVYRDKSVAEYDKIVITNNTLADPTLIAFRLDPAPKQLYPDGYPALANSQQQQQQQPQSPQDSRSPASAAQDPAMAAQRTRAARQRLQDDGTIQPFFGDRAPSAQGDRAPSAQGDRKPSQSAGTVPNSGAPSDEE
jgi:hypothetical protein